MKSYNLHIIKLLCRKKLIVNKVGSQAPFGNKAKYIQGLALCLLYCYLSHFLYLPS